MTSRWVGLAQVGEIAVSGCIALGPALPEGVVTWFVTGFRISVRNGVRQGRIPTDLETNAFGEAAKDSDWRRWA
jgi:hypothetical protein